MKTLQRLAPALLLLFISPLIAEFLLGDFNIRQLGYLGIFVPLYGACALFIREITRRTNRGWISMLLLAMVYGFIAEGIVNCTLFNTNYVGQNLVAYGFIPSLGTSFNYGVYIVTLHTVWSISTPIALAEGFAGKYSKDPWLKNWELIFFGTLALFGLVATTTSTIARFHFVASISQYTFIVVVILMLIFIAFKVVPKIKNTNNISLQPTNKTPLIWLIVLVTFVLSSAFQLWFHYAPNNHLDAKSGLFIFILIDVLAIVVFRFWSKKPAWSTQHIVAMATGTVLTYGWFGLQRLLISRHTALGVKTTPIDVVGRVILLISILSICYISLKRTSKK